MSSRSQDVDAYIAGSPPEVRAILKRVRSTIRKAAPGAQERMSYRIPAFFQDGALVYYAAFKNHVGIFPPVRRNRDLQKALAPYRGEKGNLKFPLDRPIPYPLIARVVRARLAESKARAAARRAAAAKTAKKR